MRQSNQSTRKHELVEKAFAFMYRSFCEQPLSHIERDGMEHNEICTGERSSRDCAALKRLAETSR
jgi:hypothetical protein